jgi:hypothetical protein
MPFDSTRHAGLIPQPNGGALAPPFRPGGGRLPGAGRPKGLTAYLHRKFGKDGHKLLEALAALAIGSKEEKRKYFNARLIRPRDSVRAIEILLERGWGKVAVPDPEMPIVIGDSGPEIIINIPRPEGEYGGHRTVIDAVSVSEHQP